MTTPIALTIAGSDSAGCAGIQADLKTFSALGVFGASALTAVTAQNTHGVTDVEILSPRIVAAQVEAVLCDLAVGAIKIGMAGDAGVIEAIAATLSRYRQPVVLDPVMVASSGDRLLGEDAVTSLSQGLMPLAVLVTPNLAEAAILSGRPQAASEAEMRRQAEAILKAGARAVLIKGGHFGGEESVDLLFDRPGVKRFSGPRVETANDHGTGCTLSAAIAAGLAKGQGMEEAVGQAKAYLTRALQRSADLRIGSGRGPVHHFHAQWDA